MQETQQFENHPGLMTERPPLVSKVPLPQLRIESHH
jgi:hypothetical protein